MKDPIPRLVLVLLLGVAAFATVNGGRFAGGNTHDDDVRTPPALDGAVCEVWVCCDPSQAEERSLKFLDGGRVKFVVKSPQEAESVARRLLLFFADQLRVVSSPFYPIPEK